MKRKRFLVLPALVLLALSAAAAGETLDEYVTCRFSVSPAVYTGPSDTYYRSGSGKAQYGAPGKARVYGEENGWFLIGYQTSSGQYRLGYIDASRVRDKMTEKSGDGQVRQLLFDYEPVSLTRACELTDDPVITRAPIDSLPAGQECFFLAELDRRWAYVELRTGREWKRGFVPLNAVGGVSYGLPEAAEIPWSFEEIPAGTPQPAAEPWNYAAPADDFSGVWAIANQRLVTRGGPSVLYEETGTYYLQACPVLVLARHYDADSGVWWVKCRIDTEEGVSRGLWTAVKRFYNQEWLLDRLPEE